MFQLIYLVCFSSLLVSSIAKPTKHNKNGFGFRSSDSMMINPYDVSDSSFDPFGSIDFSDYSFLPYFKSVESYVGYSDSSSSFDPFNELVYYPAFPFGSEYPYAGDLPVVTHPDVSVLGDFARFPFPNDFPFPPVGVFPHLPTINDDSSDENDIDVAKNLIFGPDVLFGHRFPFPFPFKNPFGKNFPFADDRSFDIEDLNPSDISESIEFGPNSVEAFFEVTKKYTVPDTYTKPGMHYGPDKNMMQDMFSM